MELTAITYDNNKKLNFKVSDDPVRPELDLEFRLSPGRTVYALTEDGEYKAAICLAYCNDVPTTVKELDKLSQATINGTHSSIAVAYTVWSKTPRAGRKIIMDLIEIIKKEGKASTSYLQRKLQIGYNRAARIIDQMEESKIISPANHAGKREILPF